LTPNIDDTVHFIQGFIIQVFIIDRCQLLQVFIIHYIQVFIIDRCTL